MDAYLIKLETVLRAEFDGNVIPIPLKKGTKEPLYSHKDKTTEDMWKLWKNKGFGNVLSETADMALLIRERAMVVIDLDDVEQAQEFEDCLTDFADTVKESTKKGFHYFFKGTDLTKSMKLSNIARPFGENLKVDVITTWENETGAIITVYPSADKEWINNIVDSNMLPMPSRFIDFYNDKLITKEKKNETKDEVKKNKETKIEFEVLKEVVMGMKATRADGYNTWRDATWAISNIASSNGYKRKGNNLIHEFSKQSLKYDEDKVEEFIEKSGNRDDGFGMGTLMMFLKEDNEVVFQNIQEKLNRVKKVELKGYAFIEEPAFDLFDGTIRSYAYVKREFEKTHFKVMRPIMYVEELRSGDFYMRSSKDLKEAFGNVWCTVYPGQKNEKDDRFLNAWLVDAKIRTFETIEFLPPPLPCPRNTFNMWRGFAIERKDIESSGNIQPFLDHLSILVNHDEKCVDYLVKWFSHIIQYPGVLNGISVCIVSAQGSGKNVFLDLFHKMLGKELYYETANPVQDLWSRFSLGRKNRLLINIDETSGKDTYPHAEQIKNMLTSPNYNYEQKGVNPITLNNFNRVVFTSNNLNPVKITEGERRNFVVKASDEKKGNKEYFDSLIAYFNDEANQKAVFDYLKNIDLSKVDWINDRPITEIYRDIQEVNIKIEIKYFKWLVDNNSDDMELRYTGESLLEHFHEFLSKCKYPATLSMNETAWGRAIKPYIGVFIEKKRGNKGMGYKIKCGEVRSWLIANKYMMDYMIQETEEDYQGV